MATSLFSVTLAGFIGMVVSFFGRGFIAFHPCLISGRHSVTLLYLVTP